MSKIIKTNKFIGDSMPPGLAKAIYEQAKQQSQQQTQTNQTSKSNGGTDKGQ
ncbi:hypothetical protein [Providencia alcalifaciens]|uniref:hypothetical protein n=1 Tax=Providencia alcalifaciens TaxID=126385 RepID=UPI0012B59128|nr:hypothetical protein [Providencia alcalifaciens]MTC16847.1 hypothetical protein [Providencia alcalifaciens]